MSPQNGTVARTICLFDVDETLTKARQQVKPEMDKLLQELRKKFTVGLVGGSDLSKIAEQMQPAGSEVVTGQAACDKLFSKFDYVFSENGLVSFKGGQRLKSETIATFMGEEKLQRFINFALKYLSELELPLKRGTFVEFRSGMINICPVGRSCTQKEREQFAEFDKVHNVRPKFVQALKDHFGPDFGLEYVIGGQISIDAFPSGWDKTYCLQFLEDFDKIYFFGDKTMPGGNDHTIFAHERTEGHSVNNPDHTVQVLTELFF